jgi:hypothetical protein
MTTVAPLILGGVNVSVRHCVKGGVGRYYCALCRKGLGPEPCCRTCDSKGVLVSRGGRNRDGGKLDIPTAALWALLVSLMAAAWWLGPAGSRYDSPPHLAVTQCGACGGGGTMWRSAGPCEHGGELGCEVCDGYSAGFPGGEFVSGSCRGYGQVSRLARE